MSSWRLRILLALVVVAIWLNFQPHELSNTPTLNESARNLNQTSTPKIPQKISRSTLEPARNNPFGGYVQVAGKVAPLPPPPPPPLPPPPAAPVLNMSFAGRVLRPDGEQDIYVQLNESTIIAKVGMTFSNGYRVVDLTSSSITVEHPDSNGPIKVEFPSPPKFETR